MNHSTGISDSYYRATEQELLEDYLKAVDKLSINDDKVTLQKQVAELTEKSKEENYTRDREITWLKLRYDTDHTCYVHTSQVQSKHTALYRNYYFGDDLMLHRHDYSVNMAGGLGGAQLTSNYVQGNHISLPNKRRAASNVSFT